MVDLRKAKPGDILISKHGAILEYVEELPESDYFDIKVRYLLVDGIVNEGQLGYGSRFYDGATYKNNREESDHDIVNVIDRNDLLTVLGVI
jgi:hypothetical protein